MVKRSFMPGSEWVYYKIYTGPKTTDWILTEIVLPIATQLRADNCIEKWFFIRYADPKHHLRVRFLATIPSSVSQIIQKMFIGLQPLIEQDVVWKVQMDTYNRELERYGENTIELSETLFYYDSLTTSKFIDLIEGNEGEQLRWLFGLRAIDTLLDAFKYSLEEKLLLMENLKVGFGKEFNMSRPLKKQLDGKYRKQRQNIEHFMSFSIENEPDYEPILAILGQITDDVSPIAQKLLNLEKENKLQIVKDNLMGSYIHMVMNRLFKSKNRLNEMVCYDFLYRYYKSTLAMLPSIQKY